MDESRSPEIPASLQLTQEEIRAAALAAMQLTNRSTSVTGRHDLPTPTPKKSHPSGLHPLITNSPAFKRGESLENITIPKANSVPCPAIKNWRRSVLDQRVEGPAPSEDDKDFAHKELRAACEARDLLRLRNAAIQCLKYGMSEQVSNVHLVLLDLEERNHRHRRLRTAIDRQDLSALRRALDAATGLVPLDVEHEGIATFQKLRKEKEMDTERHRQASVVANMLIRSAVNSSLLRDASREASREIEKSEEDQRELTIEEDDTELSFERTFAALPKGHPVETKNDSNDSVDEKQNLCQ
jgi:hypothetical protein